ncbi:MAG TPA: hypothetical protein PLR18_04705 [bacterium]|mgnify:CR=1 FL=1|nr:hypothetical protein [bacterium]
MAIYPSITTITPGGWREKLEEIKQLGIEEFCLFPTMMDGPERKELYEELKKMKIKKIPLVHLK